MLLKVFSVTEDNVRLMYEPSFRTNPIDYLSLLLQTHLEELGFNSRVMGFGLTHDNDGGMVQLTVNYDPKTENSGNGEKT